MNQRPSNPAVIRQQVNDLKEEFVRHRDRVDELSEKLQPLIDLPNDIRKYRQELEELKGMNRQLHQIFSSHERLCTEIAKSAEQRAVDAHKQRERIEKKLDDFITASESEKTTYTRAFIAVLVAALTFFLVPFFSR